MNLTYRTNIGLRKKNILSIIPLTLAAKACPGIVVINSYLTALFLNCCLIVWCLSSRSRIFHSYGDVTITREGLQILTYFRNLWPLSSEDSLACHAYCDTEHPFRMVISEDPWHSHILPSVKQRSCHYLFLRLRCGGWDSNTQPSDCGANNPTHWAFAAFVS